MVEGISNWSLMGFFCAVGYAGITVYQYVLKYPDVSQFIMNMAIAVLVAGISWLYSKTMNMSNNITAIEDYLSDKRGEKTCAE